MVMVFNATFNNISVISWRSVLLVEETGGPGKNHRPAANHCQTYNDRRGGNRMLVGFITTYAISTYHQPNYVFESGSGEVYSIRTDCIGSYESN
jgi:hypothetical protein